MLCILCLEDVRKVRLGAGKGIVSDVKCETIDTVSLGKLNVGLPVVNREAGGEADDVVCNDNLGNTRLAGKLRRGGISKGGGSKETGRGKESAEEHDAASVWIVRRECEAELVCS